MIDSATRGAWRDLDAKLRPFVARRVGVAADVDDVVQDVFLRMQRGLPGLRDQQRFGPWVYQVARSALAEYRRSRGRHPLVTDGDAAPIEIEAVGSSDDRAVERALATAVAPLVAQLPSPYREALTLTELEGMTQRAAAAMLGVTVSAMKSRVQRGRALLRAALEACCDIALDVRGQVIGCEPRPVASPCACAPTSSTVTSA